MIRLEFNPEADYYSITTAGPIRGSDYKKMKPLWESAPYSQLEQSNPVENPPRVTGQSGVLHQQHAADGDTINAPDGSVNLRIAEENSPRGSIAPVDEGYLTL